MSKEIADVENLLEERIRMVSMFLESTSADVEKLKEQLNKLEETRTAAATDLRRLEAALATLRGQENPNTPLLTGNSTPSYRH